MEQTPLKTKVDPVYRKSVAWSPFEQKLADVLSRLKEDQFLIVSLKHSNRFVQFAAMGEFGMRAETTSNHYLTKQEQLDARQLRAVEALGWLDPTGTHQDSTPEADPGGSPNFCCEFATPVSFKRIYAVAETVAVPFVSEHIIQIYQRFCVVADGVNSQLQQEFGGLTSFSEPVPPNAPH